MSEEHASAKKSASSNRKVEALPSKVGGYKPIQALNSGAMGNLWICRDPSLDRMVVAKRLHPHLNSNETFVKRFLQEGSILAHLNHPNIVQPYGLWKDSDGNLTMSIEYVNGSSLKELLAKNAQPPVWVVMTILYEILITLSHAHRNGVIHRDLKPANLMIDKDGRVRLLDFGIAHTDEPLKDGEELTETGCIMGTAAYMSPEQITGQKSNYSTDLFSLGVIASEMLIGENLFRGSNFEETRENILKMKFTPEVFPKDVPMELRTLVLRLLQKKSSKRPSSACDVANEVSVMMETFPRDMSPYIADWADAVKHDQPLDSLMEPAMPKSRFGFRMGFILGMLFVGILVAVISASVMHSAM